MRNKKRIKTFTLLEVTIAIVVLLLMGSITAVHITKLIQVHRFETQVAQLFLKIQEAQSFSTIHQTDIALDLSKNKKNITYRFSTLEPNLPLEQKVLPLAHISSCTFNSSKASNHHFQIYSGRIEPRGILEFRQGERKLWIDLQYGQLVKFSHKPPKKETPIVPLYQQRAKKEKENSL